MYVPPAFAADRATALAIIDDHPFATLVTIGDDGPFASHIPLLLDRDGSDDAAPMRLIGHVARANPQWRDLERGPVLAIFHGPHAYVSPRWYAPRPDTVPTWNYVAVHVRGAARVLAAGADTVAIVERLTARYEPTGLDADPAAITALGRAIVAFEIQLDHVEAKLKLSQNRSDADQASVTDQLAASDDPDSRKVAAWMARPRASRG